METAGLKRASLFLQKSWDAQKDKWVFRRLLSCDARPCAPADGRPGTSFTKTCHHEGKHQCSDQQIINVSLLLDWYQLISCCLVQHIGAFGLCCIRLGLNREDVWWQFVDCLHCLLPLLNPTRPSLHRPDEAVLKSYKITPGNNTHLAIKTTLGRLLKWYRSCKWCLPTQINILLNEKIPRTKTFTSALVSCVSNCFPPTGLACARCCKCASVGPVWRSSDDSTLRSLAVCVSFCSLQVRRGQRTVQTETKYIELMVVNDHELVGVKHFLLFISPSAAWRH